YMDVDRRYRGIDGNIHVAEDFENYTIFSLWDTYRALHPLLSLLKTEPNTDMTRSMLAHWQQSVHHILPVWSLMANEGWCMTGYHAVSVLADALANGADIDRNMAVEAMTATANSPLMPGIEDYKLKGYVAYDRDATAASNTLEYAYDDWAVYTTARAAGFDSVAEEFGKRALSYRNIYEPKTGFACPRYGDGRFKEGMDPYQTYNEGFIEGNSWNFSFHVPHDVFGMMTAMGGEKVFRERLDRLFSMDLPEKYYADNEDITVDCLVGGYVHGNEPSHHIPYLYAWTSEPWKTQQWVRTIMNRMYRNDIRGLGGNDDCGQMSAWYVFSAMGFYPVCPGSGQYVIGAPYLPYMRVTLPGGRSVEIRAEGVSDTRRYVKSLRIDGQLYDKLYITHAQLLNAKTLDFEMSDKPNRKRGLQPDAKPYSMTNGER
ncbi:MAG: GH92 family glycosyl hydrolase, partial [Bacteroidaceae bacterium]